MIVNILLLLIATTSIAAFADIKTSRNSNVNKLNIRKNDLYLSATNTNSVSIEAKATTAKKGGDATIAVSTFNLAKSIVGAGVLSLPSGIAFFSDAPNAIIPASLLCAVMGVVAAYSFSLIGQACEQHNASSFQDAWAKSVDPNSAWTISAGITAMCFLASIAYSIIIGDSFTSLAATFNLPAFFAKRSNIILAISSLVLLPLCSMKSLAALAPFSLLGLGGTLYTAIVMAIRYMDGSYAKGGKFFETMALAARPIFNTKGSNAISSKLFVLVSMLSTSFIAHYNAPAFYNELKDTSMPRFNKVVTYAFFASIVTFILMMSLGFLTFGGSTAGFVLNNYSGSDNLVTFARLAIGLALLTGYPFTFSALRDGILDLQKVSGEARAKSFQPLTIGLLTLITTIALVLKDVGFVVSVSGALFGSALMFVVPAVMNINNLKTIATKAKTQLTGSNKLEIAFNWGMVVMGIIMGALGVIISTLKQLGKM